MMLLIKGVKMLFDILKTKCMDPADVDIDPYGYDHGFHESTLTVLDYLYKDYFRSQAWGLDNLPKDSPAILVSNHAGFLPMDALMLQHAIYSSRRLLVRPLLEDFVMAMPFAAGYLPKLGFARASRDDALRLLQEGQMVLTFPEGVKGLEKTVNERCKVKRFGRGGVIKLALKSGAPIIPVAIAGPGAAYPMFFRLRKIGGLLGLPFFPVTPTFPLLGLAGLLPLRVSLKIKIGKPMNINRGSGKNKAEEPFILEMNEKVRSIVKDLLQEACSSGGRAG